MCFFQRLIGDYNRYAYEALNLNWYVEPEVVPEKEKEMSSAQKRLMAEKKAIEEGIDIKDLKLDDKGEVREEVSPSALSRKKKSKKKKAAEEEAKLKEIEEAKKEEEKPHPK